MALSIYVRVYLVHPSAFVGENTRCFHQRHNEKANPTDVPPPTRRQPTGTVWTDEYSYVHSTCDEVWQWNERGWVVGAGKGLCGGGDSNGNGPRKTTTCWVLLYCYRQQSPPPRRTTTTPATAMSVEKDESGERGGEEMCGKHAVRVGGSSSVDEYGKHTKAKGEGRTTSAC